MLYYFFFTQSVFIPLINSGFWRGVLYQHSFYHPPFLPQRNQYPLPCLTSHLWRCLVFCTPGVQGWLEHHLWGDKFIKSIAQLLTCAYLYGFDDSKICFQFNSFNFLVPRRIDKRYVVDSSYFIVLLNVCASLGEFNTKIRIIKAETAFARAKILSLFSVVKL